MGNMRCGGTVANGQGESWMKGSSLEKDFVSNMNLVSAKKGIVRARKIKRCTPAIHVEALVEAAGTRQGEELSQLEVFSYHFQSRNNEVQVNLQEVQKKKRQRKVKAKWMKMEVVMTMMKIQVKGKNLDQAQAY